jgi:lipopolysaccharide biosynthesis protein
MDQSKDEIIQAVFRSFIETERELQEQIAAAQRERAQLREIRQHRLFRAFRLVKRATDRFALIRESIKRKLSHQPEPHGIVRLQASDAVTGRPDVGIHVHVFYLEYLFELAQHLNRIPVPYACYVTTDSERKREIIRVIFESILDNSHTEYLISENRGRDIGPWLVTLQPFHHRHELWCHIHTKKSQHLPEMGARWRRYLLGHMLGSASRITSILNRFDQDPKLGLMFPPMFEEVSFDSTRSWGNRRAAQKFLEQFDYRQKLPLEPEFPAGFMFWYRTRALKRLLDRDWSFGDFEPEDGQLEGTLMHLLERSIPYVAESNGYSTELFLWAEDD